MTGWLRFGGEACAAPSAACGADLCGGAALRTEDSSGIADRRGEPHTARLAEYPAGLNGRRAIWAGVQLAGDSRPVSKYLAAPLAVAKPFGELYVASVAIHV